MRRCRLRADCRDLLPKMLPAIKSERKEMPMLPLVLSSDSHVFEPPDLAAAVTVTVYLIVERRDAGEIDTKRPFDAQKSVCHLRQPVF